MPNRYDKFWQANSAAGDIVKEMEKTFSIWGRFTIDSADFILDISRREVISPELLAVTWMNEFTFGYYGPANMNGHPEDFNRWDVGPFQLNVGYTMADIKVGFVNAKGVDLAKAFGTKTPRFSGDPIENTRLASRKLLALGRARISDAYPKLTVEQWAKLTLDQKNLRRAVLYCGEDSRDHRLRSWLKYGEMYKKFFSLWAT